MVLATICGILALILVLVVQYKVRTLFTLLAAIRRVQALGHNVSKNLVFRTTTVLPETPTPDYFYYYEMLQFF